MGLLWPFSKVYNPHFAPLPFSLTIFTSVFLRCRQLILKFIFKPTPCLFCQNFFYTTFFLEISSSHLAPTFFASPPTRAATLIKLSCSYLPWCFHPTSFPPLFIPFRASFLMGPSQFFFFRLTLVSFLPTLRLDRFFIFFRLPPPVSNG